MLIELILLGFFPLYLLKELVKTLRKLATTLRDQMV